MDETFEGRFAQAQLLWETLPLVRFAPFSVFSPSPFRFFWS